MKKIISLFAVLGLAAGIASAKDSGKSEAAPAPLSRISIAPYVSYWNVPDLDGFDLSGAFGGGVLGQVRLHKYFALEMRWSAFAAGDSEDVYVDGQGWYENDTTLVVMPLEAGLVAFLPLGETFSLYGGPGVGYYFFDGKSTSSQGPWDTTYDMDLEDNGGFYALFGARAQLARNVALFLEGKYTWVETSREHDIVYSEAMPDVGIPRIDDEIDFNGLAVNAGLMFTF